ncbi:hypothetical protein [Pectinatus sottacetonis]|uniref:hypothetical protein n=1 Tax=Pectinatus sottacetonis TaxID=1002795 RepID=UPI0018C7D123|nr:hypothetical protein [Pectinatus sottacetonis]
MDSLEYIWHHTANTGYVKRFFPADTNKDIYAILTKIFKNSVVNNDTTFNFNGNTYLLDTVLDNKGLMGRLSQLRENREIPLVEIACSDVDHTAFNQLKSLAKHLNIEHTFGRPNLPYISELLLPPVLADKKTIDWIHKVTCCLGLMGIMGNDFLLNYK